ncbi:MAG: glycosyltransferase [Clostridia bacterium]|nr:glycosyltransferase [Clostridia bacterium]
MKKIVFAVYHDCNFEARSHELLECCTKMGEVHFVSYAAPYDMPDVQTYLIDKRKSLALLEFLKTVKQVLKKVKPDIVLLHDNDCAVLIPFVKKHLPGAKLVYDSSELYIKEGTDRKRVVGHDGWKIRIKQILTSFRPRYEKKYLKYADVVVAANIERATIMQKYFGLSRIPLVFDNVHRIDVAYDSEACDRAYGHAFCDNTFQVLFAGGIHEERKTFDYIRAFASLNREEYRLVIVGTASEVSRRRYEAMLAELELQNVVYLGLVPRENLRYLMQKSQGSVVIFDTDSYNTKYCASGKCYESLFEGVPILASENPPLKRLCEQEGIGVSNDDYAAAIVELKENYSFYKAKVADYVMRLDYESRVDTLKSQIEELI